MGTSANAQTGSGGGRRPYGGFEPHLPGPIHVNASKYMQALMWFWVFYRFKEDGAVMLGLRHPWDGHGGGHGHSDGHGDDHGDGHGVHGVAPAAYTREHPGGPIIAADHEDDGDDDGEEEEDDE